MNSTIDSSLNTLTSTNQPKSTYYHITIMSITIMSIIGGLDGD